MPVYEYKGQFYDLSETDPVAAKAKITAHLDQQYEAKRSSVLDVLPKGTPSFMQSKPGQGWDDANQMAAGGDPTNPMSYLSEAQKTEQGPAMQAVSQGINRGLQVGAGIAKGAVINPVAAVAQVAGGQGGREFAQAAQQAYNTQRANAGAEGFDFAELAGSLVSPANRLIPTGGAGIVNRGALGGVVGASLNPVLGEDLSFEQVLAGKVEQMGLGALVGRVGAKVGEALVPSFRPGVQDLINKGVPVSPGQAYEGVPGWLFRQMESMGLGPSTTKVNKSFNTVVANDVLSDIGKTVPNTVKPGQNAVAFTQKEISDFYDSSLTKIGPVKFDTEYKEGVNKAIQNVLQDVAPGAERNFLEKRLTNSLNAEIGGRLNKGNVTGEDLKSIQEWLKDQVEKSSGTGVVKEGLKQGYEDVLANLNKFISRIDEDGNIAKADAAWAKLYDFAQASKSASKTGGVFSPEQLASASTTQANTLLQAGGGKGPLNPLAQQGIDVLGDQKPFSVLKGLMIGSKAATGVATAAIVPQVAIPVLVASGMAYGAAKQLMKDPSAARLAVQKALQDNPGLLGQASGNVLGQLSDESQKGLMNAPVQQPAPVTPSVKKPTSIGIRGDLSGSFNELSPAQQNNLLQAQFQKEGNKKGNLARDLNNPGAMVYVGGWQKQFGAKPGKTVKGPDGKTRVFAEFPDLQSGIEAQRHLWSTTYGDVPLSKALTKWVDPHSNKEFDNYKASILAAIQE